MHTALAILAALCLSLQTTVGFSIPVRENETNTATPVFKAIDQVDPAAVFRLAGNPPDRVMFVVDAEAPFGPVIDNAMGLALAGVLDVRDGASAGRLLAGLVESASRPRAEAAISVRLCVARLESSGGAIKRVEIGSTSDGWLLAREIDAENNGVDLARLDERRFELLSQHWPRLRARFDGEAEFPPGELVEIPKPYRAGRITLDARTLRQRIFGRSPSEIAPLDRDLEDESFFVRLPKSWDRTRPAGLLVWIHAVESPRPPLEVIAPACDELGFVIVSMQDAGNTREIADRLQLAFDVIETVSARLAIDPARIYVSGISGGGRCSSMLWGCFPDVFSGAVPIVGLNSYKQAPTGTGQAWPKNFVRPRGALFTAFKSHRLAAISGENDFNFREISVRIEDMRRDGIDVRLVNQPGMGHEMPTPETFADALRWVDEPAQKTMDEAVEKAWKILERAGKEVGERRTQLLERVMETAPWSEPAWEAYSALKGP